MYRRLKTPFKDIRAIYWENPTQTRLRFCCLETANSLEAIQNNIDPPQTKRLGTSEEEAIDFLGIWLFEKMIHSLFDKNGPIIEEWLAFYTKEELENWKVKLPINEKEALVKEWIAKSGSGINFFDAMALIDPKFRQKLATVVLQVDYLAAVFTTYDPNDVLCRALSDIYKEGRMIQAMMDCWMIFDSIGKEDILFPINERAAISTALDGKVSVSLSFHDGRSVSVLTRDFIPCLVENENFKNQLLFNVDRYLCGHRSMKGIFNELIKTYNIEPTCDQNNVYQGTFLPVSHIKSIQFRNKNIWESKERAGA